MSVLLGTGCLDTETRNRYIGAPVVFQVSPCLLGSADPLADSCQANVAALSTTQDLQACIAIEVDGGPDTRYRKANWSGGPEFVGDDSLDLAENQTIEVAVFFFDVGWDQIDCDSRTGPSIKDACDGDCLLKLEQDPILLGSTDALDFKNTDGVCRITLGTKNRPVESCDGEDNDCDGRIDEEAQPAEACSVGVGDCMQEGEAICQDGQWGGCSASPSSPGVETLGGGDEDCDGQVDEAATECGLAGTARPCPFAEQSEAACLEGNQLCGDDGLWGECLDSAGMPVGTREVCDGLDSDCDGLADEGFGGSDTVFVGAPCTVLEDACRRVGSYICTVDALVCEITMIGPTAEVCNGCDDDEDGVVDEGDGNGILVEPCYPGAPETLGVGLCHSGIRRCESGEFTDCQDSTTPSPEICDELDNDCDGSSDEAIRNACGQCEALPEEVCDLVDNDCDGLTDEGFNLQNDVRRCGDCETDCTATAESARMACLDGECLIGACIENAVDGDGDPLNGCECTPGALDLPDPERLDENCDGIDGQLSRAVMVSPDGDDANLGEIHRPVSTLGRAIEIALERDLDQIYLAYGNYNVPSRITVNGVVGPFALPDGLGIYGGFEVEVNPANRDELIWSRPAEPRSPTRLYTGSQGLLIENLTQRTTLAELHVYALEPPRGTVGSSVAILARNVADNLYLYDVSLTALIGSNGENGQDGRASLASPASDGTNGLVGSGGLGGNSSGCGPGIGLSGGGGDGGMPGMSGRNSMVAPMDVGLGSLPGVGGRAGPAAGRDGEDGGDGNRGFNGTSAEQARADGLIDRAGQWQPSAPVDGGFGRPGIGGGGGGGVGLVQDEIVAGGGGGGAGGCPGGPGEGGHSGYGSIGLIIMGGTVQTLNLSIEVAHGGHGGQGGGGADGVDGGNGGNGASTAVGECDGDCGNAGDGGDGGDGGCGGHGSGGAGGPSIGVLRIAPMGGNIELSSLGFVNRLDDTGMADLMQRIRLGNGGNPGAGGSRGGCGEDGSSGQAGVRVAIGCCHAGPGGGPCGGNERRDLSCQ